MKILLDTHVAVWAIDGDRRLTADARRLIDRSESVISVVSLWEIGLKRTSRKDGLAFTAAEARSAFEEAGVEWLALSLEHALHFETIGERHGDPFDRMLVAQALWERIPLLTHDRAVARYSDSFILI